MIKRAILLSGGIESTCLTWKIRPQLALTVDYGQVTARGEIEAAKSVCHFLSIEHRTLTARANFVTKGLLAGNSDVASMSEPEFWPYRNQFIITCALMAVYYEEFSELLIGTVKGDSKFTDGTEDFIAAITRLTNTQSTRTKILAPAISMTSAELLVYAGLPKQLAGLTFSCHRSSIVCGTCPGCLKNKGILAAYYDKL